VAAYFTVRFHDRYFRDRKLTPFAIYCAVFGAVMAAKLLLS
jgi:undecaprenyl-diphosphatase